MLPESDIFRLSKTENIGGYPTKVEVTFVVAENENNVVNLAEVAKNAIDASFEWLRTHPQKAAIAGR